MQQNRRSVTVGAAVLALGLVAAACSTGTTQEDEGNGATIEAKQIGYVTIFADPVQQRFFRVFEGAAKAVGWDVEFADAGGDPAEALRAFQNFLTKGKDAIVGACVETAWVRTALDEAKTKGIPTIEVACPISPPLDAWSGIYAEDEAGLAEALAEFVVEDLADRDDPQLAILYDTIFHSGRIRFEVFKEALSGTNVEVVAEQTVPLSDPNEGSRKAASDIMTANPGLDAILAIYDWMAPPSVSVIETRGREGEMSVYSFYADHVNLPLLLKDGSPMKAVVDGPVENVSALAVDQLLAFFTTGQAIDTDAEESLDYGFTVFTKENAPAFDEDTYLGPVTLDEVLDPWLVKWRSEYDLSA